MEYDIVLNYLTMVVPLNEYKITCSHEYILAEGGSYIENAFDYMYSYM